MLRGVYQRAAVAIVLMGSLLAPFGTCLQPTQKAAHSCCSHASKSNQSVRTNCCTATAPLPAVVVATNLPGSAPMTVAQEFILFTERVPEIGGDSSALSACGHIHLKNLNLHFRIGSPGCVSLRLAVSPFADSRGVEE